MNTNIAPMRFGVPLRFQDRWRGRLWGIEVTEDWEAVNLLAQSGLLFWSTRVKLPVSAAEEWNPELISFSTDSTAAFNREVPPVAVPARPLSGETPVSLSGVRLTGALVRAADRLVVELLVRQRLDEYRVPVQEVGFEGKTMTLATQMENLRVYRSDAQLRELAWRAVVEDRWLTGDDRRELALEVVNGRVRLHGNVRTKYAWEHAERAVAALPGVTSVANELVHDMELERCIGMALERSGLQRQADIYIRSSLGEVTVSGYAATRELVEETVRVVSRVPGVRRVINRMQVRPGLRPATGGPQPAVQIESA